ncbi:MAG: hypothetical protein AB7D51_12975 [Desulfovibrionaceae bacterium]
MFGKRPPSAPATGRTAAPLTLSLTLSLVLALSLLAALPVAARAQDARALIARAVAEQGYDLSSFYEPPDVSDDPATPGYIALGYARADIRLADGATAFAASGRGLAVGFADGTLQIFGPLACGAAPAEGQDAHDDWPAAAVALMGYAQDARYALAVPQSRDRVAVFDLERCAVDRVLPVDQVVSVAVSRSGEFMAVAREDGVLLAGPLTGIISGGLHELPLRLDGVLAVGFGPDQGVLVAVDRAGLVVLWNLLEDRELGRFSAGQGPFVAARFEDERLLLARSAPNPASPSATPARDAAWDASWDLAARKPVPFTREQARYSLADGALFYRTFAPVLRAEARPGPVRLRAAYAPSRGMLGVDDPDGVRRCYDAASGLPAPCLPATDWTPVDVGPRGELAIGTARYRLADTVYQNDHDVLLARWNQQDEWFLWWVRDERLREDNPLPGHLPQRESILSSRPVVWAPILPPPGFP